MSDSAQIEFPTLFSKDTIECNIDENNDGLTDYTIKPAFIGEPPQSKNFPPSIKTSLPIIAFNDSIHTITIDMKNYISDENFEVLAFSVDIDSQYVKYNFNQSIITFDIVNTFDNTKSGKIIVSDDQYSVAIPVYFTSNISTSMEEVNKTFINHLSLKQNYPNPFNPVTTILYSIPKASNIELSIYNVAGQKIETLVNEFKTVGEHKVYWNASGYASGLYLYQIKTDEYVKVRKMLFLK